MTRYRGAMTRHQLSVNNDRCHRYGICQAQAPELFQLTATGLRYRRAVTQQQLEQAKSAVRCCPTLAIAIEEKK
jgi:ferredoxin